jgi:hypothetical protein
LRAQKVDIERIEKARVLRNLAFSNDESARFLFDLSMISDGDRKA